MNAPQKWIAIGVGFSFLLVLFFPAWRQTYQGHPLVYNEHLGHHFTWPGPSPTGEKSWLLTAPPSECHTSIERDVTLRQCGSIIVMAAILLFAFRRRPPIPLTTRTLTLTSFSLAVCLPMPLPDGFPVVIWVGEAIVSPFRDNGHVGPWATPMIAGIALAVYSTVVFFLLKVVVWIATRRAHRPVV